jgi:hypothetical protein
LQAQWEEDHNSQLNKAVSSGESLAIQLKESFAEECESEKESIRDTLTSSCDKDKEALQQKLRNNLKLFSKKAVEDANKRCDVKMADFKQSYLEKYEEDIQTFTEQMNQKIQTDRKQLQDGLNEKCESEKDTIQKDASEKNEQLQQ